MIRARFERGRVTGFSGCNNLMGSYTLDGNRLALGPLAGTMMACPEPGSSIENAFKAAFAGTLRYAITGDRLSLTSEGGATLIEKEPAPRLEGVTWEASVYNNNRQAVVGLLTGTRPPSPSRTARSPATPAATTSVRPTRRSPAASRSGPCPLRRGRAARTS